MNDMHQTEIEIKQMYSHPWWIFKLNRSYSKGHREDMRSSWSFYGRIWARVGEREIRMGTLKTEFFQVWEMGKKGGKASKPINVWVSEKFDSAHLFNIEPSQVFSCLLGLLPVFFLVDLHNHMKYSIHFINTELHSYGSEGIFQTVEREGSKILTRFLMVPPLSSGSVVNFFFTWLHPQFLNLSL